MKFRTDFVTNSSSSSFILTVRFDLKNGENIEWKNASDCGEGSFEYVSLTAMKSPKQLGENETVEELVSMMKSSIGEYIDEDDFREVLHDDDDFIKKLNQLNSMEEISKITIEGYEDLLDDGYSARDEIVSYDVETKTETGKIVGADEIESEGSGGNLLFRYEHNWCEASKEYFDEKRKEFREYYE